MCATRHANHSVCFHVVQKRTGLGKKTSDERAGMSGWCENELFVYINVLSKTLKLWLSCASSGKVSRTVHAGNTDAPMMSLTKTFHAGNTDDSALLLSKLP